jgi:LPXTG-motif cell wall-anchored protein
LKEVFVLKTTKKLLCALLTMIMLLSLFPMSAFASGEEAYPKAAYSGSLAAGAEIDVTKISIETSADSTAAATKVDPANIQSGKDIEYTVTYNGGTAKLTLSSKTLKDIDVTYSGDKLAPIGTTINIAANNLIAVTASYSEEYLADTQEDVTGNATIPETVAVNNIGDNKFDVSYGGITKTLNVTGYDPIIKTVAVTDVTTPTAGSTLATTATADNQNVRVSVAWNPSAETAAYNTQYTAIVTVTANAGYRFADDATVTVNGNSASVSGKGADNSSVTVSYTFPNATAKAKLQSIGTASPIEVNYGTAVSSISFPTTVDLVTDAGTVAANVTWNKDASNPSYNAKAPASYTFTGTVTLPDNIDQNGIQNLSTSIVVTVKDEAIIYSVKDVTVQYDGKSHTIDDIKVTYPSSGAAVTYSAEENGTYSGTKPTFTTIGAHTVYYKITAPNLTPIAGSATVNITKRSLYISANNQTKIYGAADPYLSFKVAGLMSGHTLVGALTRESGETVGTYKISQGTLTVSDSFKEYYDLDNMTFTDATLTISKGTNSGNATAVKQSNNVYIVTDSNGNSVTRTFSYDGATFSDTGTALTVGQVVQYNGNSDVTLNSSEHTNNIDSVYIGTNRLGESCFSKNGSSITISNDYLKTLPAGGYIISMVYGNSEGDYAVTTSEIVVTSYAAQVNGTSYTSSGNYSPKTGDTSNLALWIGILVVCAAVIVIVAVVIVKNKKKNDEPKEKE